MTAAAWRTAKSLAPSHWGRPHVVQAIEVVLGIAGVWLALISLNVVPNPWAVSPRLVAPSAGASVEFNEPVSAICGGGPDHYYPVVMALDTGAEFVAGPRLARRADGTCDGYARFGDSATPPVAGFRVRIVRSASELPEGLLRSSVDLGTSEPVLVHRR